MRTAVPTFLSRLRKNRQGAVAIEFGLLGLFMIAVLLGSVQVGMSMQRYNALRSIAADVARNTVVQYQGGNEITSDQIRMFATSKAQASPYFLPGEGLLCTVTTPGEQRVAGATEFNLEIRTQVDSITSVLGFDSFYITYSRPIFVLDE